MLPSRLKAGLAVARQSGVEKLQGAGLTTAVVAQYA
jgi:hypothetical protein